MKKLIYILIISVAIFNFGCNPKFDASPDIGSLPTGDFTITEVDANNFTFDITGSDGFLYSWDFGNDETALGEEVDAYYPFKNDYTVTCVISGKGGSKTITKNVTIETTDPNAGQLPIYKELTDGGAGRTWVYAIDAPAGRTGGSPAAAFCYMVANYDLDEYWWDPYEYPADAPIGIDNEMTFELGDDFIYTFYPAFGDPGVVGSFRVNAAEGTIRFIGANIPDYDEPNLNPVATATNVYSIYSVTDDELIITQDQLDWGYSWVWVFKRKGYTYP